ncbi:cytochrome-c peroxidase [Subsaximicrobium wynnwilliamsii]|uniref:Methylamine utilization protein MauG n=1 Tax=Subsaximicrobium wynnwilliamsii TaxID=291179 RepID=A0A5C6ZGU1_9FLAO|nr:cytochrome c peroxidase [Subsaximicrobium wynnwilliamsii]TXD82211.1 cytochrome-c peroxidase [Subsaximicrobium wynnwilliamsii]TXD87851.1 cytochrome-c peroxidase [Subsaximicrobium wynnwilliamsii]TXE01801.1 cytochrome-c peroxidase [Subsaximicrobium wynnwilliamsii]
MNVFTLLKYGLFVFSCCFLLNCKVDAKSEYVSISISNLRAQYAQADTKKWPEPELDSLVDRSKFEDLGVLPEVEYPNDNPFSEEKKQLGKLLFFDARLSESKQIACANCHNPELAWTDNITRSLGHERQENTRNAMSIMNVAFAKRLFWDGRAESLEHQASFPISDPVEMNTHSTVTLENIANIDGYKPLFTEAFGDAQVTLDRVLKAIATFERSLVSRNSKFDKFVSGKAEAFTDQEVLGLHLFRTKARCINCHNTPYFSDNLFHNDGQALFGTNDEDFGLYNHTNKLEDLGKFRTPSLREVAMTGPWMHHGHFPSLLDVVEYYNLGNPAPIQKKYLGTTRDSLIPTTSPMLEKLELNKTEVEAIIAFLETLSTKTQRVNLVNMPE